LASTEASANVQSVASAAEELSGSVAEIGRQVQASSRIAADAVQQAQRTVHGSPNCSRPPAASATWSS
jgi:methyl-accepting chemotaxis protein